MKGFYFWIVGKTCIDNSCGEEYRSQGGECNEKNEGQGQNAGTVNVHVKTSVSVC